MTIYPTDNSTKQITKNTEKQQKYKSFSKSYISNKKNHNAKILINFVIFIIIRKRFIKFITKFIGINITTSRRIQTSN